MREHKRARGPTGDTAPPLRTLSAHAPTPAQPPTCQIGDKEAAICPQVQPVLEGLAFLPDLRAAGRLRSGRAAPLPRAVGLQGLAQVLLQGRVGDVVGRPVDEVQWEDPKHSSTAVSRKRGPREPLPPSLHSWAEKGGPSKNRILGSGSEMEVQTGKPAPL